MKILFVLNDARFFLTHRLPLAQAALDLGYEVHVATPHSDGVERILSAGLIHHAYPLDRRGLNPLSDMRSFVALTRLFKAIRPDLIHTVTVKPVLYGGLAARLLGVPVVSAISGLGYAFAGDRLHHRLLRTFIKVGYRWALDRKCGCVIVQNPDDRALITRDIGVDYHQVVLIPGSGVDLRRFRPSIEPRGGQPVVMLASRMLWDKGIAEFVEAARRLRAEGLATRFVLVGDSDPGNPAAVPRSKLVAWRDEGIVEWWGRREDMDLVLAQAQVVCLPSYYREGVPKILLEAAAAGRAIVTTDMPGCRDAVIDGRSGILVRPRDAVALANAVRRLVENPLVRKAMAAEGRRLAEEKFDVAKVVEQTMRIYRTLVDPARLVESSISASGRR